MTQAKEPSGQDDLYRTVRALDRRVMRLEDTQITNRELGLWFDRVYLEIDGLKLETRELREETRELREETREIKLDVRELKTEIGGMKEDITELNSKFDIIMHYITGNGSSGSQQP